jgi:hypothetical protein
MPPVITGERHRSVFVARAIHNASNRRFHPMNVIPCGALSELVGSELFGYGVARLQRHRRRKRSSVADGAPCSRRDQRYQLPHADGFVTRAAGRRSRGSAATLRCGWLPMYRCNQPPGRWWRRQVRRTCSPPQRVRIVFLLPAPDVVLAAHLCKLRLDESRHPSLSQGALSSAGYRGLGTFASWRTRSGEACGLAKRRSAFRFSVQLQSVSYRRASLEMWNAGISGSAGNQL